MKLLQRTAVALVGVAALATVPARQAHADVLPSLKVAAITPLGGGLFRWDYAIQSSNSHISIPGHFIIYDFGMATNVLVPAGWGASDAFSQRSVASANRGTSASSQTDAMNWMLTYAGLAANSQENGQAPLGASSLAAASFVGDGLSSVAVTANPEPASLVLLGTGMLGIVGIARRRNKR